MGSYLDIARSILAEDDPQDPPDNPYLSIVRGILDEPEKPSYDVAYPKAPTATPSASMAPDAAPLMPYAGKDLRTPAQVEAQNVINRQQSVLPRLARGTANVVESVGGGLEMAGRTTGAPGTRAVGRALQRTAQGAQKYLSAYIEDPETDLGKFVAEGVESLPYMALSGIVAAPARFAALSALERPAVTALGRKVAETVMRGPLKRLATRASAEEIAGTLASTFTNMFLEGGGHYAQAIAAGKTPEQAEAEAKKVFAYNGATALTAAAEAKPGMRLLKRIGLGAGLEGLEEAYQGFVGDVAEGRAAGEAATDPTRLREAAMGAVFGGPMAAMGGQAGDTATARVRERATQQPAALGDAPTLGGDTLAENDGPDAAAMARLDAALEAAGIDEAARPGWRARAQGSRAVYDRLMAAARARAQAPTADDAPSAPEAPPVAPAPPTSAAEGTAPAEAPAPRLTARALREQAQAKGFSRREYARWLDFQYPDRNRRQLTQEELDLARRRLEVEPVRTPGQAVATGTQDATAPTTPGTPTRAERIAEARARRDRQAMLDDYLRREQMRLRGEEPDRQAPAEVPAAAVEEAPPLPAQPEAPRRTKADRRKDAESLGSLLRQYGPIAIGRTTRGDYALIRAEQRGAYARQGIVRANGRPADVVAEELAQDHPYLGIRTEDDLVQALADPERMKGPINPDAALTEDLVAEEEAYARQTGMAEASGTKAALDGLYVRLEGTRDETAIQSVLDEAQALYDAQEIDTETFRHLTERAEEARDFREDDAEAPFVLFQKADSQALEAATAEPSRAERFKVLADEQAARGEELGAKARANLIELARSAGEDSRPAYDEGQHDDLLRRLVELDEKIKGATGDQKKAIQDQIDEVDAQLEAMSEPLSPQISERIQAQLDAFDALPPEVKAAQDRAVEQGYVYEGFHGTKGDIEAFDPEKLGVTTDAGSARLGFFFAADPETAEYYAIASQLSTARPQDLEQIESDQDRLGAEIERLIKKSWSGSNGIESLSTEEKIRLYDLQKEKRAGSFWKSFTGDNILPVRLKLDNPLVHDYQGESYREVSYRDLLEKARVDGHDGAIFKNTRDGGPTTDIYVVFDPSQVRSKYALYEPGKESESNILAQQDGPPRWEAVDRRGDEAVKVFETEAAAQAWINGDQREVPRRFLEVRQQAAPQDRLEREVREAARGTFAAETADVSAELLRRGIRTRAQRLGEDEAAGLERAPTIRAADEDYYRVQQMGNRYHGGQGQRMPQGQIEFYNDKAPVVRLFRTARPDTLAHEAIHHFRRELTKDEAAVVNAWVGNDGQSAWTVEQEERWAEAGTRYLFGDARLSDELPTGVRAVLEKFKAWLGDAYRRLRGRAADPNDDFAFDRETQKVFEDLFGGAASVRELRGGLQRGEAVRRTLLGEADGQATAPEAGQGAGVLRQEEEAKAVTRTPAFKRWFGDSKVVDEDGEPLVVYHGTRGDFDAFAPWSHFGTIQAAQDRIDQAPEREGDGGPSVVPVFLSIARPYRVSDPGVAPLNIAYQIDEEIFDSAVERWVGSLSDREKDQVALLLGWDDAEGLDNSDIKEALIDHSRRGGSLDDVMMGGDARDGSPLGDFGAVYDVIESRLRGDGYDGLVYKNDVEDRGMDSYVAFDPTQIKSATGNRGTFDPDDPSILRQDAAPEEQPRRRDPADLTNEEIAALSDDEFMDLVFNPPKPSAKADKAAVQEAKGEGQKERGLGRSLKAAGRPIRDNLYYTPIANAETEQAARARVEKDLDKAQSYALSNDDPGAEHTATGLAVIAAREKQYHALRAQGKDEEAAEVLSDAYGVASALAERLTRAGQEVQAAKLITRLSPEGILFYANKQIDKINANRSHRDIQSGKGRRVLEEGEYRKLRRLATQAKEWGTLEDQASGVAKVLSRWFNKGALTKPDVDELRAFGAELDRIVGTLDEGAAADDAPDAKGKKGLPKGSEGALLRGRLEEMEDLARQRLRARGYTLRSGLPLEDLVDMVMLGTAKLGKTGLDFQAWSADMTDTVGDVIQPHLRTIYRGAAERFRTERSASRRQAKEARALRDLVGKVLADGEIDAQVVQGELFESLAGAAYRLKTTAGAEQQALAMELAASIQALEAPTLGRRVASARYMAMLLNPKTIGRNLLGNEAFWHAERLSKLIATPIDIVRAKASGDARRVTVWTGRGATEGNYAAYLKGGLEGGRAVLRGSRPGGQGSKYDIKGSAFRSKYNPFMYAEKALGLALQATDYAAYTRAKDAHLAEMARLAWVNAGKPEGWKAFRDTWVANADAAAMEAAENYGKYATFQDENKVAKGAQDLKRIANLDMEFGLGDLLIPFPKTPTNLALRAMEYSPLGFLRSAWVAARPWRKGAQLPAPEEWEMALARAIVGTGLTAFGWYLVEHGALTGSKHDEKSRAVKSIKQEQTGERPFQVNASALDRWLTAGFDPKALKKRPNDTLYSYDWALPMSMSVTMGANAQERAREAGKAEAMGAGVEAAGEAILSAGEALEEQPMLQALQAFRFGGVTEGLLRLSEGVAASFVPTLANQLRQVTDNDARELHELTFYQRAANKALYRLPFIRDGLPKAYKTLGESVPRERFQNGSNTLFNVFFNPAFVATYKPSPGVRALLETYDATGNTRGLPKAVGKTLTIDGRKIHLTGKDKAALQRVVAAYGTRNFKELDLSYLRTLTPDEQVKAFAQAFEDGYEQGRTWFRENRLSQY